MDAPSPSLSIGLNPALATLACAQLLVEACKVDPAIKLLEDVAHNGSDPVRQIDALCSMAKAFATQLQSDRAQRQLNSARCFLAGCTPDLSETALLLGNAHIDMAAASLTASISPDEACTIAQKTLTALQGNTGCNDVEEFYFETLLFAAEQAWKAGRYSEFRNHLVLSQSHFAMLSNPTVKQIAKLHYLLGLLACDPGEETSTVISLRMQEIALEVATKHGLIRYMVDIAIDLGSFHACMLGDIATAMTYSLPVLALALQTGDPVVIGCACAGLTYLHNIGGHFYEALDLYDRARGFGTCRMVDSIYLDVQVAKAYLGLRDYDQALRHSAAAIKAGTTCFKSPRLVSAALRTAALAHFGKREMLRARACIGESLELAEKVCNRNGLASAYFASAVITGNRGHARRARTLNSRVASFAGAQIA
jgi:hypothetical protein